MDDLKFEKLTSIAVDFLERLIRFPSLSGNEEEVMQFMFNEFKPFADEVTLVPLSNDLLKDPEYSTPLTGITYEGRHYLKLKIKGTGNGRSVIFNAHADVVPAQHEDQFNPFRKDGKIFGRGAMDDKGHIATLFLLLQLIKERGIRFSGDMIIHIVVEEENGGNGTLAAIRGGDHADAVIGMESSNLNIFSSVRGAVWFKIKFFGIAGHSGYSGKRASALKMAIQAMEILENYHKKLLAQSRGIPLFDDYENPMPLTFGKLHAGNWPAAIPGEAVLEGVLGFLPNKTRFEVMEEIESEIKKYGDEYLREHFIIEFTYRHEAHTLDVNHPLITVLSNACESVYKKPKIDAMIASCDSWFYSKLLNIPTVVFGPGNLLDAHTRDEHIEIEQIKYGSKILLTFLNDWCSRNG